jgi:uncharacterized protein DUF3738
MLALKRRLYSLILRLHPAAFRSRFAREMALDFDDALAAYGFPRLLADATRSLIRQWMTAPAFTPNAAAAPIPSHPLLAGHYLAIDDDNLKPFEILRGMLIFLVFAFLIGRAFNAHPGHVAPIQPNLSAGHDGGVSIGHFSHTASPANPGHSEAQPDYSQTLAIPTSSLPSGHGMSARKGHAAYVNPAAKVVGPQTESWKEFLTRCALITAIVWLTSLLLRRTRSVSARMAFVAAGLFVVACAALMPLHLADTSAQAEPLHPGNPPLHFESATIRLRPDAQAAHSATVASGAGAASANLVRIDSSIRTLLAQACNVPPESIVGGPGWLDSDSYDITATIDPPTFAAMQSLSPWLQQSQVRWMEQELLVSRFHLKVHVESRQPNPAIRTTTNAAATDIPSAQVLVIDHIERPSEN